MKSSYHLSIIDLLSVLLPKWPVIVTIMSCGTAMVCPMAFWTDLEGWGHLKNGYLVMRSSAHSQHLEPQPGESGGDTGMDAEKKAEVNADKLGQARSRKNVNLFRTRPSRTGRRASRHIKCKIGIQNIRGDRVTIVADKSSLCNEGN
jgi:hypothetical protein